MRIDYVWNLNNTLQSRTEANYVTAQTAVVRFQYDNRDRLIHETRVVNGSTTVYDLWYTYDGLGNRLEKRDEAPSPRTKTMYFYDANPANRDPNYPTNNNRLMRYEESVDNGQGGWTLTRTVRYVYYITGHASNIIVKDIGPGQEFIWHRGLALYYTSAGQLWRAVWEHWQQDGQGNVIPLTYGREKGREFYYDGPRQRYLSRALDVSDENPNNWKPTEEAQLWTDYLGDDPYADFAVVEKWDGVNEKWYIESQTEKLGYLPGYGTHAQQDAQTGTTRYLHGDLIDSTMMLTDQNAGATETLAYTAFGEPVGPGGVGVPPASDTRYRYAGGWGYEDDLLKLDGAPGTKPIALLHVGYRWYQPTIGRFIQRDPVILRLFAKTIRWAISQYWAFADAEPTQALAYRWSNAYVYTANEPATAVDPLGLWDWGKAVVGAGVGAACGALTSGCNPYYTCVWGVGGFITGGYETGDERRFINWYAKMCKESNPSGYWCFQRGTKVATPDGPIAIEELRVGSSVRISVVQGEVPASARHDESPPTVGRVTWIGSTRVQDVVRVRLAHDTIVCTSEHPFWVRDKGWRVARDLRAGDMLLNLDGEAPAIIEMSAEHYAAGVWVYTLAVEPGHTYYVGESSVLVHNKPR